MSQAAVEIAVDPERIGDKHYRYMMPSILTKVEGNGNGIKTVFPNLVDVANAIGRPAEVINKFFGSELGALSNYIKADEKFLVMGSFQRDIIQQRVYSFIRKYVLCTRCRNPETTLSIKKKAVISTCGSCGHKGEVAPDRTVTLLMQYLEANPNATAMSGAARAVAGGDASVDAAQAAADEKAAKKARKDKKKAEAEAAEAAGTGAGADLLTTTDEKTVVGTEADAADPRPGVIEALKAGGEEADAAATGVVHQQKQLLALSPTQVIRLVMFCVFAAAAPEKPLGAIMRHAGFIRNFREIGPDAPLEVLAELEAEFVKGRNAPEKMAMAVVLLMDEEVLLRSDLDAYKAALEKKERKAVEKAGGVPPAVKSRQRLVLDALEPIFDWTQVTTN
jgi:translation initiation factor 2 beta subunit (eIF-2beta)/eIF-5